MSSETIQLIRYFLGGRAARTSVRREELRLLLEYARGSSRVAEVGVFEGATSAQLAAAMPSDSVLYLIDPFRPQLKIERLVRRSLYEAVARRSVSGVKANVEFIRGTSADARNCVRFQPELNLVFVDGDHSYEAVRQDLYGWGQFLAVGGRIALHDSRIWTERPDLSDAAGPVELVREIEAGAHPEWKTEAFAGTLTVLAPNRGSESDTRS